MAQTKLMNEQEAGVENVIALDCRSALKLRLKLYKKQKRGKITNEEDEIVAPDIWARAAVMSPSSLNVNLRDGLTDKDVGQSEDEALGLSPANQEETTPSGPLSDFMKVDSSNYDVLLTDFTEQNEFAVVKLKQDSEVTDFSLLYSRLKTQECNFVKKENESNDSHVLRSPADDQSTSLTSAEEAVSPTTSQSQNTECTDDSAEDSLMEEESPLSFSASGAGTGSEIGNPRKRKRSKYVYHKLKKAKTLREHGKPYLGKSVNKANGNVELKQKKGRKLGKRCSCTVDYKGNKCRSLDEGERQKLFDHIWSMSEAERRIWISSVVNVSDVKKKTVKNNSRRSNTMVYYLLKNEENVKVCKTFFLQTTGLCQGWVRDWALKGKDNNPPPGQNTSDTTKYEEERPSPQTTPAPAEEKCPNKKSEKDEPHGVPLSTVKVIGGRETVTERDKLSISCQLSVKHPDATTAPIPPLPLIQPSRLRLLALCARNDSSKPMRTQGDTFQRFMVATEI